jgi:uncharacterized BrkB/YihY/UPF0761 family membrane protein
MTTLTQEHRNHTVAPGLWAALRASVAQWSAHKDARVGAAIAYYSIFSIGPLIVVAISIASLVFDREGVQREVISSLQSLIGNKGAESVNSMLGAAGSQGEGLFATAIGVVTLLYAAISLVVQLKEAMNSVWEVETTPGSGLWLFEIGKYVIAFYIGKQGLESKYGAAASIVVVLVWIYYTAQLILLGAEFTNVRHRQHSVH